MKKFWLVVVGVLMCGAPVFAQSISAEILDLKAQALEAKGRAVQRLTDTAYARENMATIAEMGGYMTQLRFLDGQGLLNNLLDYAPGTFPAINEQQYGWMTDTLGYVDNPVFMCDEWGMNPNDPMVQMMLQYMQGPWKRESMFARCTRLYNKAAAVGGQALILDESLVQFFDGYSSCIETLSLIDQDDPNNAAMCMMYYYMIEWYETQLLSGYTASLQGWNKSTDLFQQSRQDMNSINTWTNEMFRVLSLFP